MSTIQGYPNTMEKVSNKWLLKFPRNNVVTAEDHIYVMGQDMDNVGIEHENVAMRLFASSLIEEALDWFIVLLNNHLTSYKYFSNLFKSRWSTNKEGGTLGAQFNQINKKENETVKEFNARFDRLYNKIPTEFCPTTSSICLLYMNAFEGKFCFILKDKNPTSLAQAKEYSVDIEENLFDSRVEPFQYSRVKVEANTKVSNNSDPDLISLLTQKIDQMSTRFT
jgi:hypothetical protein